MVDIGDVSVNFLANVGDFVSKMEALTESVERFRREVDEASLAVAGLHTELNLLPDNKIIHVTVEQTNLGSDAVNAVHDVGNTGAGEAAADLLAEAAAADDASRANNNYAGSWARVIDVERDFSASMVETIAAVSATSGAEERLFTVNSEGVASTVALTAATKDYTKSAAEEALALEALRAARSSYDSGMDASIAGELAAVRTSRLLTEAFAAAEAGEKIISGEFGDIGSEAARAAVGMEKLGGSTRSAGQAAFQGYGWFRLLFREVSLFSGIFGDSHLIGSIPLWHLALDALLESFVATLQAGVALTAGFAAMIPTAIDIATRLKAIAITNDAANASIYPLTGNFQKLAKAMAPGTLEIYGGLLDLLTNKSGALSTVVGDVVHGFDSWIAKLDVFESSFTHTGALMKNGVDVLHQFAEILQTVGGAIDNLVKADPGTVHYLLDLVQVFAKLLEIITMLPTPILLAAMALHSFMVWGGLLFTMVAKLLTPIRALSVGMAGLKAEATNVGNLSEEASGWEKFKSVLMDIGLGFTTVGAKIEAWVTKMVTAAAEADGPMASALAALKAGFGGLASAIASIATNPFTWLALAAAGLTAYAVWALNAKNATQQWVNSIQNGVQQARGLAQVGQTYQALGKVTEALVPVQRQYNELTKEAAGATGLYALKYDSLHRSANNAKAALVGVGNQQKILSGSQQELAKDFETENKNVAFLAKTYGVNYVEAAELAGNANADLTRNMQGSTTAEKENYQLVQNLVRGYGGLGAVQGTLGADLNGVTFATELQNSKVGQLNQSMDTFFQTLQAPSNAFLSLNQNLAQFNSDAKATGATMTGLGGSTVKTTRDVNNASIQLQQDFNNTASTIQQMEDALRTEATISGSNGLFVQGTKAAVAALIPMAGHSQQARQQVEGLAEEAGGPVTTNLASLAKWAGNVKNPMATLQSVTNKAGAAMANLGQDAQNLANTIQGTLNQTLVTQAESLEGLNGKTATYLQNLEKWGPSDVRTQASLANLNSSQSEANYLASQGASGIQALTGKTDNYGASLSGTSGERNRFNNDLNGILSKAPNAGNDVMKLTNAVVSQGKAAASHSSERAALIRDLENAGISAQKAAGMVDDLIGAVAGLHSKTITIGVNEVNSGTIANVGRQTLGGHAMASGGRVPGYGGGDTHPAMLEGGEAVVPKHLVSAVAPFLSANRVPGFDIGGIMGSGGDRSHFFQPIGMSPMQHSNPAPIHVHLEIGGREIAKAILPSLVSENSKYNVRNSGKVTGLLKPT